VKREEHIWSVDIQSVGMRTVQGLPGMTSHYCSLCGQRLKDSFYTVTSSRDISRRALVICADCFSSAPRCCFCGQPMAEKLAQHGVCVGCLASAQRCHACGKPVREGIELQDGTDRIFCLTCVQTLPVCLACRAPVDGRGCRLPDGRVRCHVCNASAIDDPGQAQALYMEVQDIAARQLDLALSIPTPLVLVDSGQLQAVLQTIGSDHPSETKQLRGVYARKGLKRGIYVESGLPRVQMIEVIAHELGHAWQAERKPLLSDPVLVEGFAEWVAYKVLDVLGETTAQDIMLKRTDVYGQGLRRVLGWQIDDPTAILNRSG